MALGMAAPASPHRVPGGLKGRWKLDENTGTSAADSSGTGNTGTLTNGVTWVTGQAGSAISLNGTNQYVTAGVTGLPAVNGSQTIAYWQYVTATPSGNQNAVAVEASGGNAVQLGYRGGQVVVWKSGGAALVQTSSPPSSGAWHHVAYTYDGTTHTLYIDGVSVNTSTTAAQTGTPTSLNFGRYTGGEYFAGQLDEIRIYSRTLTAAEVQGLAQGGALEVLLKLDEGSGTTASDSSGMGHDGTLNGGVAWVTGQSGQALSFDGVDDYVSCSLETGLPANNAAQTIVWRMNVASNPSGVQCAIDLHNDSSSSAVQCGFRNSTVGVWNHGGNVLASATPPSAGNWHHYAYTYDGTTHKLYIDGTQAGSSTATAQTAAVTSFVLGRWNGGAQEYFAGKLDDLRIYSRTLSADEVAGLAGGTGTGLAAVYYDNKDWTGSFIQRTDAQVNFNWGTGSPDAAIGADTFSAVWTGQVQPQYTEPYTFYLTTDDGGRLWVDGKLLIDFPQDQGPTERSATLSLGGGTKYNIRIEYFENGGGAVAELRWSSPSTTKAFIPQLQLYPTDTLSPSMLYTTSKTGTLTKTNVRFSERMDKSTVETTSNWTFSGGLSVTSVSLLDEGYRAEVTSSAAVTLNTTTITSANLVGITREAVQAPLTKTIVSGTSDGIPDSIAVTLTLSTSSNQNVIQQQGTVGGFDVPDQGLRATLTLGGASGSTTLRSFKKLNGTSTVTFNSAGGPTSITVTGPTMVNVFAQTTGAFKDDFEIQALDPTTNEFRGKTPGTVVNVTFTYQHPYEIDQRGFQQAATMTPAIQAVTFDAPSAWVVNRSGHAVSSQKMKPPTLPATNASGVSQVTLPALGIQSITVASNICGGMVGSGCFYKPCCVSKPKKCLDMKLNPDTDSGTQNSHNSVCHCEKNDTGYKKVNTGTPVDNRVATSVDLGDGEKKLDLVDLAIRGRGLNWEFRRLYRSFNYRKTLGKPSDFGENWIFSYNDEYLLKDGTGADNVANYIQYRDGGYGGMFINQAAGQWESPLQQFVQLRINSSGDLEMREESGLTKTYTNFSTGGTPSKNGRLKELRDRNDNVIRFFYEQIDPDSQQSGDEKYVLAYVIDTMGREIRYTYYARTAQVVSGRQVAVASTNLSAFGRLGYVEDFKGNMDFTGATQPDFTGQDTNRRLVFDYDAEGNLVKLRSPIVTGTPNGNDFPNGKTFRYRYYTGTQHPNFTQTQWDALTQAQKDRLLHKLTHIWDPNEVRNSPDTDPAETEAAQVLGYETNTSAAFFGFVKSYQVGDIDASGSPITPVHGNGVPSGGTIAYAYTDLDPARNWPSGTATDSTLLTNVKSLRVDVTDRNGNTARYIYGGSKTLLEYREFSRGLRAGEPTEYLLTLTQDQDRLLKASTTPEGMVKTVSRPSTSDRFQQSNIVREVLTPGPRSADQTAIETVTVYEPVYNEPWLVVSSRGSNSSANGFTPPIADLASRTITDPYDATKTLNLRYAVVGYFDYQESTLASTAWSATSSFTPTTVDSVAVKATEVLLLRKLGLPDSNDTDRTNSTRELRNRLAANLVKLGLGDLNGDGNADPAAAGNVIRRAYGSPVLLANTNQHKLEGDIETAGDLIDQTKNVVDGGTQEGSQGARLQTIVWMYQYNTFGQMTREITPEGNVTTFTYNREDDADGDGNFTPTPADGRTLSPTTGGYLKETLRDTTRSYVQQTTGTTLTGTVSNNKTNPAIADIKVSYTYDDVGNVVTMTNGRGIRTDYFVNELDQVIQTTRAADISGAASANPSDPLYNHSDTQQKFTAFAYKSRTYFDYNNNVVLSQAEDRGNTFSVDGSGLGALPSQATETTPGLSSADSSGGEAYLDSIGLYDRLNNLIETRVEVDSTRSLNMRFRYDGNQHLVLAIHPEGNADSSVYDERDLLFQTIRGASSRPSAGKYASGDPSTFNRPGGSGTTPSTMTYNYDKDKNIVESVDAADTDGDSSNNSSIAGVGDVTSKFTYDGYNRRKTVTDPLGNKTNLVYDPDSNVVRVIQDGDPIDDVVGSSENKTLSVTETVYDELSRTICVHQVLFQTPDATPSRTPLLTDTPAMDTLAAYLSDASSDTASVPGATEITVIGRVTSITEYDRESRRTFRIQDDLDVSRTDYDGTGRVVKTTDDALSNGFSSGAYDPAAIAGNTVEMAYDDNSNVIEMKETDVTLVANVAAEVFRTTLIYDSLDRPQTSFDNLGHAVDLRYDSRGNRVAAADAVGTVTSRSFSRRGLGSNSAVTINNYGNVSRRTYDGVSRLLETEVRLTSSGQGDGTNIGATLEGVKTTAPTVDTAQSGDGLISAYYAYDDNSQLLGLRDDDGNVTGYIYDNQNRTKVERKGLGVTGTSFSLTGGDSGAFNIALRGGVTPVDTETSGTDITLTYDPDSNAITKVDEAGNSTACTYDAINRKKTCTITPASGFVGTTSQTRKYDGLSRLTECFDNNGSGTTDDVTDKHFYDSLSRAVEESQQIGSLSTRAISYSYELDCSCGSPALGLPSETTYPDGRRVHSEWDRLDRLTGRHDVEGTTEYSAIGTYQYVGRSRVAVLTYQNNIRLTHIGQVSSQNADVGFDGLRRIVNHRWESFTTQALGSGTLVMGFEQQDGNSTPASMYDRAGNKRIEYKTHDSVNSEQYKYDSAYRLASTGSGSQGTDARAFERGAFTNANRTSMSGGVAFYQDWDLEGVGNWSRQDDNSRVETRNHSDFNEINQRTVGGQNATLTYDKNGNTTDTGYSTLGGQNFPGGGLRLEYDTLNRLKKVYQNSNTPGSTGDDVLVAEYVYDGQNRRMQKAVTNSGALNGTTSFYYEGWRVIEERDGSDAVTNQYTYGKYLDEVWTLDNRRSSGTVANLNDNTGVLRHFYLSNTLYHVCGLTNEGSSTTPGTLKEAYQYDAYGKQTVITDGNDGDAIVNFNSNDVRTAGGASTINGNPYMYTGQRIDGESGLLYFKSRFVSCDLGRFIGRDPTTVVKYEYVLSRPLRLVDTLGLVTTDIQPAGPEGAPWKWDDGMKGTKTMGSTRLIDSDISCKCIPCNADNKCFVPDHKNSNWSIKCHVKWYEHIFINPDYAADKEETYGHEQRHIANRQKWLKEIIDDLEKFEKASKCKVFSSFDHCDLAGLQKALEATKKAAHMHKHDVDHDFPEPEDGKGYPPIGTMPPKPGDPPKPPKK
jgi:RHS repeat-associated protein